jgi:hypothetical protein
VISTRDLARLPDVNGPGRHCSDSRYRGPVPVRLIDGVVRAIYWPPGRWRVDPFVGE